MCPILTAFATSPDRGQGLARDMRVRWALEELGVPYNVQLLGFAELKQPAHLARNPFGQIPTWQDGGQILFESARSCCTWPSSMPACFLLIQMHACARSCGCSLH